jgi:hypothetical protein
MRAAIDESEAPEDARAQLHAYMTTAAEAMRTVEDHGAGG